MKSTYMLFILFIVLLLNLIFAQIVCRGGGFPVLLLSRPKECSLTTRHHAAFEIWGHQSKLPKFLQLLAEMGEEHAARCLTWHSTQNKAK